MTFVRARAVQPRRRGCSTRASPRGAASASRSACPTARSPTARSSGSPTVSPTSWPVSACAPRSGSSLALPDGAEWVGALFGILAARARSRCRSIRTCRRPRSPRFSTTCGPGWRSSTARWSPTYAEAIGRARERRRSCSPSARRRPAAPPSRSSRARSRTPSPRCRTHRDDPAVMLFSGGTTGRPKAVVQPHRSYAFTTVAYGQGILGLGRRTTSRSRCPSSTSAMRSAPISSSPSRSAPRPVSSRRRRPPTRSSRRSTRHRPTPAGQRADHDPAPGRPPGGAGAQDLSSLRLATSAGEALPRRAARALGGDLRRRAARRPRHRRAVARLPLAPARPRASRHARRDRCPASRCASAWPTDASCPTARSASSGCAAAPARSATSASTTSRSRPSAASGW